MHDFSIHNTLHMRLICSISYISLIDQQEVAELLKPTEITQMNQMDFKSIK